jgi:hypothetical protein
VRAIQEDRSHLAFEVAELCARRGDAQVNRFSACTDATVIGNGDQGFKFANSHVTPETSKKSTTPNKFTETSA